jgi:hypothetical protein
MQITRWWSRLLTNERNKSERHLCDKKRRLDAPQGQSSRCQLRQTRRTVLRLRFWRNLQPDGVRGVLFVPELRHFLGAQADVGTIVHLTSEGAGNVERRENALVDAHAQVALGIDGRAEDGDAGMDGAPFLEQTGESLHFDFLHVLHHAGLLYEQ